MTNRQAEIFIAPSSHIPPKPQRWAGGGGFWDTYGQNVTISPSVVFEPAGPPVGSRYHSWKRQVEKAVT